MKHLNLDNDFSGYKRCCNFEQSGFCTCQDLVSFFLLWIFSRINLICEFSLPFNCSDFLKSESFKTVFLVLKENVKRFGSWFWKKKRNYIVYIKFVVIKFYSPNAILQLQRFHGPNKLEKIRCVYVKKKKKYLNIHWEICTIKNYKTIFISNSGLKCLITEDMVW